MQQVLPDFKGPALHPPHRLVYADALLFHVKGTETVEAAANSFCGLFRNWPRAVFLKRTLAEDLSVPFGHDSGLEPYLEQLALVKHEENNGVEDDRSPRVTGSSNPFQLPMFSFDHRRAADTRFFRGRELLHTAWAAGFLRAPRTFDLSHWLPPLSSWEPHTGLWVATPVVVSYLAVALRNDYSSVWQEVYAEYYCNLVAAWVHTLQEDKLFTHLDDRTLRHFDVLDTSKLKDAPDGEAKYVLYGKMRQAMKAFSCREVLKNVVWRDRDSGEARRVRITVDATKEYGFCLRHPCVDFDWALDPNAPLAMARITSNQPDVWRRGRRAYVPGAHAVSDAREGRYRSRSPGAIARRLRPGRLMPLGQPARLPPRRLPYLGLRVRAMYARARPVGRPCRRWLTPGLSRSPACGPLLSARTEGASSLPCPSLDRLWLAPLTATLTMGDSRSTWGLFSRRTRPRRRALTRRVSLVVGPMRVRVLRRGLRPRRATRVRVVSRRIRRQALARAAIPAVTRVVVTRRRSDCYCKVGGSVDRGGVSGRVRWLCFVFLARFCLVTCVRPLPSFLLVIISMKEVAGQHGPWCGSRIHCVG